LGSPFLSTESDVRLKADEAPFHLFVFLLVCAQTYEENEEMFSNGETLQARINEYQTGLVGSQFILWLRNSRLGQLLHKMNIKIFDKGVLCQDSNWNIYVKLSKVQEYLEYYVKSMPDFKEKGGSSIPSGIDWKQNIYTIMRNEYHYSESTILNMPVSRLFYEWCSFAEKNGAIKVSNKFQVEALKMIREGAQGVGVKIERTS
jgi:hypothetical protein